MRSAFLGLREARGAVATSSRKLFAASRTLIKGRHHSLPTRPPLPSAYLLRMSLQLAPLLPSFSPSSTARDIEHSTLEYKVMGAHNAAKKHA